ncbi:MAG: DsrE family protein [Gammaproteobacteria bacterium]|nr:DsrE family protein [Gammaproteobacteria bacterium]
MKNWFRKLRNSDPDVSRRKTLGALAAGGGLLAMGMGKAHAEKVELEELKFPGDEADYKVVYQFNKSDPDYHNHVLFSVGAVLRKYGDNVRIVVTCFGPGLHILAKKPGRPVTDEIKQRVKSLSAYGVEFHACGNTMKSLKWTEKDLYEFATIVEVGASDLIELQADGYSYISW